MSGAQPGTDDPVAQAARRLLDDLMPVLRAECPGQDDKPLELPGPWASWAPEEQLGHSWLAEQQLRHGTRLYRSVPRVISAERMCASRILSEIWDAGRQTVDDLTQAMKLDPTIGPRLDHEVTSSGVGGTTWQALTAVQLLIDRAIEQREGFDLDPARRDPWVGQWVDELRRPSDLLTVIVALSEFKAEQIPIVLEKGLEIVELSDEEISAALAFGVRAGSFFGDSQIIGRTFGIRTSFESPLFVDGVPTGEGERDQAVRLDAHARAELVLLALRVFKAGRVKMAGNFSYTKSASAVRAASSSGLLSRSFGWPAAEPYVLSAAEAPAFREFWTAFQSARSRRVIEGAVRRFGYAAERTRSDDEIVDLLIAAESLFLTEIDSRAGELRFRLSTRVASFLGETLDERLQIAKFMRHAYDARSGIVHGAVPRDDDLRTLDGDRVSVEKFADELEAVLRRALRAAITRVGSNEPFPPDWDELLFSGPPEP